MSSVTVKSSVPGTQVTHHCLLVPNERCTIGIPFSKANQYRSSAFGFGLLKSRIAAFLLSLFMMSCFAAAFESGSVFDKVVLYKRGEASVTPNYTALNDLGIMLVDGLHDITTYDHLEGDLLYNVSSNILIKIESVSTTGNYSKRYNCPSRDVRTTQYQVAAHGYWWSAWEQATLTMLCGQGGGGGISRDILWTIGYGISVDAGIEIDDVVAAMAGIGVSIEESVTRGCLVSCDCSSANVDYDKACVWEQSRLSWSDTQKQLCDIFSDCDGGYKLCGAWGPYQHTNAPFKDAQCGTDYQYGCSHNNGCT